MKNNQYKQNLYEKEMRRTKRFNRMTPEQKDSSTKNLLNRNQKRSEIKNQIIDILKKEENLAIVDIQKILGLNRNTFNYWLNKLEKERWFKRKSLDVEGEDARGQPKTLILNKKKLKEMEQYSSKHWKSFEEYNLKSIFVNKILEEIRQNPESHKQLQKIMELFKQDNGYGAKLIFLLYSDFIKIDYKFSLTEKGEKELEKLKKRRLKT